MAKRMEGAIVAMAKPTNLRVLLAEGRYALSKGRVPEIVALVENEPRLACRLIEHLFDDDPGVAQRAADVLERVSHAPSTALRRILATSKDVLLGLLSEAALKKVRWNLALTVGRLPLASEEARRAAAILEGWLSDSSSIVKAAALQGLADLARNEPALLPPVLDLLRIHGRSGTPAMRARSRLLLQKLEPSPPFLSAGASRIRKNPQSGIDRRHGSEESGFAASTQSKSS
jgi:hypothetical protein